MLVHSALMITQPLLLIIY